MSLKIWNKNKPSWCVPKKGSADYREVRAIMDRLHPMPKTRAQMRAEAKQREVKQREVKQVKQPMPKTRKKPNVGNIISDAIYMEVPVKEKYEYMKKKGLTKNMVLNYIEGVTSTPLRRTTFNKNTLSFLQRYAEVCENNDEDAMRRLINNLKEIGGLKMRKAEKLNNFLKAVYASGFLTSTKGSAHIALGADNLFPSNIKWIKKTCPNEVKQLKREINKFKNNEYGWSRAIMKKVDMPLIDKVLKNLI
jgi:hypothetical protein